MIRRCGLNTLRLHVARQQSALSLNVARRWKGLGSSQFPAPNAWCCGARCLVLRSSEGVLPEDEILESVGKIDAHPPGTGDERKYINKGFRSISGHGDLNCEEGSEDEIFASVGILPLFLLCMRARPLYDVDRKFLNHRHDAQPGGIRGRSQGIGGKL